MPDETTCAARPKVTGINAIGIGASACLVRVYAEPLHTQLSTDAEAQLMRGVRIDFDMHLGMHYHFTVAEAKKLATRLAQAINAIEKEKPR